MSVPHIVTSIWMYQLKFLPCTEKERLKGPTIVSCSIPVWMQNTEWVSRETRLPIILIVVDVSDKVLTVDSLISCTCTCTCITHELLSSSLCTRSRRDCQEHSFRYSWSTSWTKARFYIHLITGLNCPVPVLCLSWIPIPTCDHQSLLLISCYICQFPNLITYHPQTLHYQQLVDQTMVLSTVGWLVNILIKGWLPSHASFSQGLVTKSCIFFSTYLTWVCISRSRWWTIFSSSSPVRFTMYFW